MCDAGVVAHEDLALCQYRCQSRQGHVSQHHPRGAKSVGQWTDAEFFLGWSADQNAGNPLLHCPRQHSLPAFQGPQLMAPAAARMYCQNTLARQDRRLPETVGDSPGLHAGKHERLDWRNSTCKSQNGFQKMVGYVCRAVRVGRPDNDFAATIPLQVVREGCVGRWQVGGDQIKRRQVSRQLVRHPGFAAEQPVDFPLLSVNDSVGIGRVASPITTMRTLGNVSRRAPIDGRVRITSPTAPPRMTSIRCTAPPWKRRHHAAASRSELMPDCDPGCRRKVTVGKNHLQIQ